MGAERLAVVGAGIVGLAAADALLQAGAQVTVFERGEPGGEQSAGRVRVFRHVHAEAALVPLVVEARAGWREWERRFDRLLLGAEGVLYAGEDAGERAAHLAAAGVEHRLLDAAAARGLHPLLVPPDAPILHDPGGGVLRARAAVEALSARLGERLVRDQVLEVGSEGSVWTAEGEQGYDGVLVCAGAGSDDLARPLGVDVQQELRPHVRATYPVGAPVREPLPCWLDRSEAYGVSVYSSQVAELDGYAVGLAVDEPGVDDGGKRSLALLRRYVQEALPGLAPGPVELRPCVSSHLPWHADAFAAWQAGRVVVFAGSNLFKFAPLLGLLLARAALAGEIPPELRPPG